MNTPGILAAGQFRSFWLQHSGTEIKFGSGVLFEQQVLTASVQPMVMKAVALATAYSEAAWILDQAMGNYNDWIAVQSH